MLRKKTGVRSGWKNGGPVHYLRKYGMCRCACQWCGPDTCTMKICDFQPARTLSLLHFVCTAGGTATPHVERISVRMTSWQADLTRQVLPTSFHVFSFVDWLPQLFTFGSLTVISFDVFYFASCLRKWQEQSILLSARILTKLEPPWSVTSAKRAWSSRAGQPFRDNMFLLMVWTRKKRTIRVYYFKEIRENALSSFPLKLSFTVISIVIGTQLPIEDIAISFGP